MLFYIKLADQIIKIKSMHENVYYLCKDYLVEADCEYQPSITIIITKEIINAERSIALSRKKIDKTTSIKFYNSMYLEKTAVLRLIANSMHKYNTILVHGAVVSTNDYAYMLVAPSGTGKTTRAKLWIESIPNSYVINGDKPFVRIDNTGAWVYGSPWSGKEGWNTNTCKPLRAIFFLERVNEGEENSVKEISQDQYFIKMIHQTHIPNTAEGMANTLKLLQTMGKMIKTYRFKSTPTIEAIQLAYSTVNSELTQ